MSIDEAIEHCNEVASRENTCESCASDHIQLGQWLTELKELRTKYKYVLADIQNIKKRHERERMNIILGANKELLLDFLDIYDDLNRAITSDGNEESIRCGVKMIAKKMKGVLDAEGCEKVETNIGDVFDHKYHNAVYTEHKDGIESGRISSVHMDAWTINGELLRPANVGVAR